MDTANLDRNALVLIVAQQQACLLTLIDWMEENWPHEELPPVYDTAVALTREPSSSAQES